MLFIYRAQSCPFNFVKHFVLSSQYSFRFINLLISSIFVLSFYQKWAAPKLMKYVSMHLCWLLVTRIWPQFGWTLVIQIEGTGEKIPVVQVRDCREKFTKESFLPILMLCYYIIFAKHSATAKKSSAKLF